jgi:hypothetical protein
MTGTAETPETSSSNDTLDNIAVPYIDRKKKYDADGWVLAAQRHLIARLTEPLETSWKTMTADNIQPVSATKKDADAIGLIWVVSAPKVKGGHSHQYILKQRVIKELRAANKGIDDLVKKYNGEEEPTPISVPIPEPIPPKPVPAIPVALPPLPPPQQPPLPLPPPPQLDTTKEIHEAIANAEKKVIAEQSCPREAHEPIIRELRNISDVAELKAPMTQDEIALLTTIARNGQAPILVTCSDPLSMVGTYNANYLIMRRDNPTGNIVLNPNLKAISQTLTRRPHKAKK